ncbi:hypothetical protein IAU59_003669 [Kwoniella sp. CBS 9459]
MGALSSDGHGNGNGLAQPSQALAPGPTEKSKSKSKSKHNIGWDSLPVHLLHNILSFAQQDITLDESLHNAWGHDAKTAEIALAISQRIWLCQMRGVCTGWKHGVDSHAFWPAYTLLLDPSRPHSSTIEDIHSARLTPSTPSFPTLFHRSRHTTLRICLACRLNHPARLGFYPAIPKRLTWTCRYGRAPTCDKHASHYCSDCMKEFGTENFSPTYARGSRRNVSPEVPISTGLLPTHHGDTDGRGLVRPRGSLLCMTCRTTAITHNLRHVLEACSRGTLPITTRGLSNPWLTAYPVRHYVQSGFGTAHSEAKRAIEERWLQDHTRWNELRPTAEQLQMYEKHLKAMFFRHGTYDEEPRAKENRLMKEAELRGGDWDGTETARDRAERFCLYKKWWQKREDMEDGDANADEVDSDDDLEEFGGLNVRYYEKLREGCLSDWINDRFRFGFWVSPSDEVRQHVISAQAEKASATSTSTTHREDHVQSRSSTYVQVHTPFNLLAPNAHHPFQGITKFEYTPINAEWVCDGLIDLQLDPGVGKVDPFLPPQHLLVELDELFHERLASKTAQPMTELMLRIRAYFDGDDDEAEKYCQGLSVGELMEKLKDWKLWVPRQLANAISDQADQGVQGDKLPETHNVSTATERKSGASGPSAIARSGIAGTTRTSPRIEMVEESIDPSLIDYGIKEIEMTPETAITSPTSSRSSSTVPGDLPMTTSEVANDHAQSENHLGKRKSLCESDEAQEVNDPSDCDQIGRGEKRLKSSPSSAARTPASRPIPTTPHPELEPSQVCETPLDNDDNNHDAHAGSGGTYTAKKPVPPSPEPHHIDRSQRTVSPPSPPRFDLPLDRIKRGALSVLEGSSAPVTPTPFAVVEYDSDLQGSMESEVEDDEAYDDEEEDEEMNGDEYELSDAEVGHSYSAAEGEDKGKGDDGNSSENSDRELFVKAGTNTNPGSTDSSELTSVTMPLTPESEPGSGAVPAVTIAQQKKVVIVGQALGHPSLVRAQSEASTSIHHQEQEQIDDHLTGVEVDLEEDYESESESDGSGSDFDTEAYQDGPGVLFGWGWEGQEQPQTIHTSASASTSNRVESRHKAAPTTLRPVDQLKQYVEFQKDHVPFIPLPFRTPAQIQARYPGSNPSSGVTASAKWSLGPRTEKEILENWYESRSVLRECRCRICERAKRREWDSARHLGVKIPGWD